MYGAPYIFYFVHLIVKTVKMMVQRVDFERNLKNICPATVGSFYVVEIALGRSVPRDSLVKKYDKKALSEFQQKHRLSRVTLRYKSLWFPI